MNTRLSVPESDNVFVKFFHALICLHVFFVDIASIYFLPAPSALPVVTVTSYTAGVLQLCWFKVVEQGNDSCKKDNWEQHDLRERSNSMRFCGTGVVGCCMMLRW